MTRRLAAVALGALLALPAALPAAAAEAAPASAAPESAEAAGARVAAGSEIPYEQLVDYVGAEVEVHTKFHTVRHGVLEGYSSIAINLRLPESERGLLLGMPRDSVAKVVLIADRPAKS